MSISFLLLLLPEAAEEVTEQAKQLQGVVVGDQGRPRSPVMVITDCALMVAVVHPVVVVVHSAQRVVAVAHSADESKSPFQGTPPKIHIRVLARVRSARTRRWNGRRGRETKKKVVVAG